MSRRPLPPTSDPQYATVSRQRKYQLRKRACGLCGICGKRPCSGERCTDCRTIKAIQEGRA